MRARLLPWILPALMGVWGAGFVAPVASQEAAPVSHDVPAAASVAVAPATASPAVRQTLRQLAEEVQRGEAAAWRWYGIRERAGGTATLRATLLGATETATGALIRQQYTITGSGSAGRILASGTHDLWLEREEGGKFVPARRFPDPPDALDGLRTALEEEATLPLSVEGNLLHLVAARRGARWLALRRSRWSGTLLAADRPAIRQPLSSTAALEWLRDRLRSHEDRGLGTLHLVLQRAAEGWIPLDAVWQRERQLPAATESEVTRRRQELASGAWSQPEAHVALARALTALDLHAEAQSEYEKASLLRPGLVSAATLAKATELRPRDLQLRTLSLLQQEGRVGVGVDHPTYLINALARAHQTQPSPLTSLRLAQEYSRLAQEERAAAWMADARRQIADGALDHLSPDDVAWVQVLQEHLQERARLSPLKPQNILRSAIFTVRCRPGEPEGARLLAALEAAQHKIYANFALPMGSTEVVLWESQAAFQQYTSKFSAQAESEFVAALTLTKLISTQQGPWVLGEEINVFLDDRTDTFATLAHELGHVAVRQLSRGRWVPVWLNEGIASVMEGGYEGYVPRVQRAARAGTLLTMRELQDWQVDGERAFLAYSQANSMVDYIIARFGGRAVLEILRQLGKDRTPEAALRDTLELGSNQLYAAWKRNITP